MQIHIPFPKNWKKSLNTILFYKKKAVIHEMYYEDNYKLRVTGKSANIS